MSVKGILIQERCNHCSNRTNQRLEREYWFQGSNDEEAYRFTYFFFICEFCKHPLLYCLETSTEYPDPEDPEYGFSDGSDAETRQFFFSGGYEHGGVELVWPKRSPERALSEVVPSKIKTAYNRALKVKSEPNSFAVQIRRTLEAICIDRGGAGKNLQEDLKKLSQAGEFPPVVAEIALELKDIGNTGAHVRSQAVQDDQVQAIDDFSHLVVNYVYEAPARLEAYRRLLTPEIPEITSDDAVN